MPGFTRGCLVQLALWAGFSSAYFFYLRSLSHPAESALWPSIWIGLLAAMALTVFGGVITAARERHMLVQATTGSSPPDGKWIAVSGQIRTQTPVEGPMSGDNVVAYEYKILRTPRTGKNRVPAVYYDGRALAASVIATPSGSVRVLSVPSLEVPPAHVDHAKALRNVAEHLRTSTFEKRDTASERVAAMRREEVDDDGVFRTDRRYFTADINLADGYQLEERHIRQGDWVCAFGFYSRSRGGLLHHPKWGTPLRLVHGTSAEAVRTLSARIVRYIVFGLILSALAVCGAILISL